MITPTVAAETQPQQRAPATEHLEQSHSPASDVVLKLYSVISDINLLRWRRTYFP